jgi:hypothetical protein
LTRSQLSVGHLSIFGCIAHVKDVTPHLPKLEDQSKPVTSHVSNPHD